MAIEVVSRRGQYKPMKGDVYIGRPGPFGNPFAIGPQGSREEVIEKFRLYLRHRPELIDQLRELKPLRLVCWCAPYSCHGDVLAEELERTAR